MYIIAKVNLDKMEGYVGLLKKLMPLLFCIALIFYSEKSFGGDDNQAKSIEVFKVPGQKKYVLNADDLLKSIQKKCFYGSKLSWNEILKQSGVDVEDKKTDIVNRESLSIICPEKNKKITLKISPKKAYMAMKNYDRLYMGSSLGYSRYLLKDTLTDSSGSVLSELNIGPTVEFRRTRGYWKTWGAEFSSTKYDLESPLNRTLNDNRIYQTSLSGYMGYHLKDLFWGESSLYLIRDFFFHARRSIITIHEDFSVIIRQIFMRSFFPRHNLKIDFGPGLELGIYSSYRSFRPPSIAPLGTLRGEIFFKKFSLEAKGVFLLRYRKSKDFEEKTLESKVTIQIGLPV